MLGKYTMTYISKEDNYDELHWVIRIFQKCLSGWQIFDHLFMK